MTDFSEMGFDKLIEIKADIKEQKSELNEKLDELKEKERLVDSAIINKAEDAGTTKASGPSGSITVAEDIVPDVFDWDTFHAHILDTGDFSLLQRRPAAGAFREAVSLRGGVPGVAERKVKKVNFRTT